MLPHGAVNPVSARTTVPRVHTRGYPMATLRGAGGAGMRFRCGLTVPRIRCRRAPPFPGFTPGATDWRPCGAREVRGCGSDAASRCRESGVGAHHRSPGSHPGLPTGDPSGRGRCGDAVPMRPHGAVNPVSARTTVPRVHTRGYRLATLRGAGSGAVAPEAGQPSQGIPCRCTSAFISSSKETWRWCSSCRWMYRSTAATWDWLTVKAP